MSKKNIIAVIIIALLWMATLFITISWIKKPYIGIFVCAIIPVLFIPMLMKDNKHDKNKLEK